jgi:transcriptional regulator with XRE-family HTH domain
MPNIYEQIGNQIRELRTTLRGDGISQEELAQAMKTTANTISRWETATYKPSISELETLARFFGVSITVFFPQAQSKSRESRAGALLSAAADLDDDDLEEVALYARFRRAQRRKKKKR